ncbi:MAG: hypothetical protein Q9166_004474 [cf. Caloplaca sp. 2 TL-2023]
MLFTWDTTNLCIIFPQWRISSTSSLFLSLVGVIALTAGYELVREMSRRLESSSAEYMNKLPTKIVSSKDDDEDIRERSSSVWAGKNVGEAEKKQKIFKAVLYAVQVFYSFFIMCVSALDEVVQQKELAKICRLLFMTYNGWVMLAVAVGAFVGYLAFGNSSSTKSVACH